MLRNRIYYGAKPFVPQRVRMAIRRQLAMRRRPKVADIWPIMPGSERPPKGWPGWPEGKKFAVVLTHDVEGPRGLDKCRALMELEMEMGFRSCFNFIPQGSYRVPASLREELITNGFEVGVHDLKHDGRLFRSAAEFHARARSINEYLHDWNAVGFRSGFMLHKLDWLHELDIEYDMSTFDTDPFEPQPEGRHTIFPFWVPAPSKEQGARSTEHLSMEHGARSRELAASRSSLQARSSSLGAPRSPLVAPRSSLQASAGRAGGYVELPYTLPQDSTLFLLLQERNADLWLRKVDWIAEHAGMVLINVHPDYVRFPGEPASSKSYDITLYRKFLEHLREKYDSTFWQPLPKQMAAWYTRNCPAEAATFVAHSVEKLKGKRAAVLLYSYYPADPRPKRAAEALAAAGMEVDLICLRESASDPKHDVVNDVRVTRLAIQKTRDSKLTYFKQYGTFLAACFSLLTLRSFSRRYDLVHVHNMPDVLVFSAAMSKILGAKVILDLHDPMPELMASIYGLSENHRFVRWLKCLERLSINFADFVLTPNKAFRELFISRGCPPEKIDIVMNSPQSEIFDPSRFPTNGNGSSQQGAFRIMYHGLIAERHGLETALRAIHRLKDEMPDVELHVYGGRTRYMDEMERLAAQIGADGILKYHGYKPQAEIAEAISKSHLGLIPNQRSTFTEINLPTRIFEYLAMGKPVIVPNTRGIRDYFSEESAVFFEPGNVEDLANGIRNVFRNDERAKAVVDNGRSIYQQHLWESQKSRFTELVSSCLRNRA